MLSLQDIINLLDRRFAFLTASKRKDFMLDLANFVEFLLEHNQIKDFTMKIYNKFAEEQKKYMEVQEQEKEKIVALAKIIRKNYPETDDSNKSFPDRFTIEYMNSFTAFDDTLNNDKKREGFSLEPDMMTDESVPSKLLGIILNKIEEYEGRDDQGKKVRRMDEKLVLEYYCLNEQRRYNFRKWLNSCRVSAGNALLELYQLTSKINPQPRKYENSQDRFNQLTSIDVMKSAWFDGWIEDATYGVVSKYSNYKPTGLSDDIIDKNFENLKYTARRIYEAVREEIGSSLIQKQVLDSYKTRSTWYNYEEIWSLVTDSNGKLTNKREHLLTLDLAKFLFDNGIPTIYRLKAGQHEMDMVDPNAKSPLLIEVKVYKDSSAKKDIISGLAQLHSYLNNLSATRSLVEGFYIIYRFGGPLYELPEKIVTNRFIINSILIDLGKSKESGRKQKEPIIISEKEIIKRF